MSNWFSDMSTRERRTFWACFSGWALDAMDVQLYAVAMPTLIGVLAMSRAQAGMLATSALILSSAGGWMAGMLADRIGRVKVLQITILWFSVFTFLSGFANSYEQLLVLRSLQGLGFGGEWAAGAVLMAEVINPKARGRAVGCVQSGWSVGYGAAALLFTADVLLVPARSGVALPVLRRHPSRLCRVVHPAQRRRAGNFSRGQTSEHTRTAQVRPARHFQTAAAAFHGCRFSAGRGHSRWELHRS